MENKALQLIRGDEFVKMEYYNMNKSMVEEILDYGVDDPYVLSTVNCGDLKQIQEGKVPLTFAPLLLFLR